VKKIVCKLLFLSSFSSLLYCMEIEDLSKIDAENKEIINNNDLSSSNIVTQQNNINPQSNKVPNLNLTNLPKYKSIKNIPKTTVRSHTELMQEVSKAKQTHRAMFSDSSGQNNKSTHDTIIDINSPQGISGSAYRKKEVHQNLNDSDTPPLQGNDDIGNIGTMQTQKSILPRALLTQGLFTNLEEGKSYSEQEVWEFLKATNSALHTFSVYNNLSLDDVIMYAKLLDELNVHPQILVEHIKNKIKLEDKKVLPASLSPLEDLFNQVINQLIQPRENKQAQEYEKIKKNDPEKYQSIVLEMLKAIVNQEDGKNVPSPLNDTHIELLEKNATNNESTIRYQYIALAVSLITWLGGYAWGIYGQITGGPTSAPTRMPTNSPTYMPTGAPI